MLLNYIIIIFKYILFTLIFFSFSLPANSELSVEEIKLLFIQLQHKFDLFYGESDVIDEASDVINRAKKVRK